MDSTTSVRVRGLHKAYGETVAVDGVDLDISHGGAPLHEALGRLTDRIGAELAIKSRFEVRGPAARIRQARRLGPHRRGDHCHPARRYSPARPVTGRVIIIPAGYWRLDRLVTDCWR